MIRDERSHLQWVDDRLRGCSAEGRASEVADTLRRYRIIDCNVYRREVDELAGRSPSLKQFAEQLRAALEAESDA